ncbi:hypothetical protein ACI77O_12350 [Pseudomonas tritici]|uniref:hypothetical protein n=1 Tax=Pseudomonas tritici TaxID=2745518 RepID=UPI00387B5951
MACTAFQIISDDVEAVLNNYHLRLVDSRGQSNEVLAGQLINEIDHGRVEKAALDTSTDMDAQTTAAHDEIKAILVVMGVLEF